MIVCRLCGRAGTAKRLWKFNREGDGRWVCSNRVACTERMAANAFNPVATVKHQPLAEWKFNMARAQAQFRAVATMIEGLTDHG